MVIFSIPKSKNIWVSWTLIYNSPPLYNRELKSYSQASVFSTSSGDTERQGPSSSSCTLYDAWHIESAQLKPSQMGEWVSEQTPIKKTGWLPLAVILKEKLFSAGPGPTGPVGLADCRAVLWDRTVYDWSQAVILLVVSRKIIRLQTADSFSVTFDK